MELTHTFSVPAPIETTWAAFNDPESIAPCMPGAVVTVVDDNDFTGTIKIKLGPISLVYAGSGTYIERDEAGRRVVIDAKGKDKRGQGTAGAKVTARLVPEDGGTRVEVRTDLAITGKPAQFGRGVIQDVSDKLLSQFVGCISDSLSAGSTPSAERGSGLEGVETAQTPAEVEEADVVEGGRHAASVREPAATPSSDVSSGGASSGTASSPHGDPLESAAELDLGSTVVPVLARRYGPAVAVGTVALALAWWLVRRRR